MPVVRCFVSIRCVDSARAGGVSPTLRANLPVRLDLDRHPERQRTHAHRRTSTLPQVFSEDLDHEVAEPVDDLWVLRESRVGVDHAERANEPCHAVEAPEGIAHGFQTLMDDTTLFYQMSVSYVPESVSGVRWNDPAFNVEWPIADPIVCSRDSAFPDFIA